MDDKILIEAIKCNSNLNQVCLKLNLKATNTVYEKLNRLIEENNIDTSHFSYKNYNCERIRYSLNEIFTENTKVKSITKIKHKLIDYGLRQHKCECCGNTTWNNKPIPLELHHINGVRTDNRLDNLQLLCPNCHAQTDNYCGKNKKDKKDKQPKEEKKRSTKCPDKETLISLYIEHGSFVKIGKLYGVSDNAVKKWFKQLGFKSSIEVRSYITETYGKQQHWYDYINTDKIKECSKKRSHKLNVYENGMFLCECGSVNEASRLTGVDNNAILRMLNGKNTKQKKYTFEKLVL